MSTLRIQVLTPPSPYRTYLEERLQSARGLGWTCDRAVEPAPDLPDAELLPPFAASPEAKPA